ncbi:hypothetical protein [Sphingomicrobium astaxanthinifaciens]|uniref:hypothetical protein n=1 Tax=Sphingomicrobium astaxanthinifaciens TaxID=1227949 RepID=UPI001FCC0A2A|nr:hypothetical protein [Sphingomicrobium astaxanthinifaciens]MCJ7421336.1 hypothetical protein [Sphingomicrobium astaxanthinifaciens]
MAQADGATPAKKPVVPWFAAMAASLLGIAVGLEYGDIDDPLLSRALLALPILFLVKAGLNAAHNVGRLGPRGRASRAYLVRMLIVSVAYVGAVFAASALIDEGDPVTPLSIAIAIVPGLAIAGYFYAMGRFLVEQQDEFMRMLMVRQTLVATAVAFSAASIYGFLENFGQVPHLDAYWWPITFFFGLGLGALVNKLTFGTYGEGC